MIEIKTENFEKEVLQAEGMVVVKMYRDNCQNCIKMAPVLEALASQNPKVKFTKVNADQNRDIALPAKFKTLPAIFFFEDGEYIGHNEGIADINVLKMPFAKSSDLKSAAYDLIAYLDKAKIVEVNLRNINALIQHKTKKREECIAKCAGSQESIEECNKI